MRAFDLRVDAIVYSVHETSVEALWIVGDDRRHVRLGSSRELAARAELLREELRDTMQVSLGRVPLLDRFAADWGRALMPAELVEEPPDVLVIVPHSFLHDVPLHLALTSAGVPLATVCGVSFASSMSLFTLCARRNPVRGLDLDAWRFEEEGGPTGNRRSRRLWGGGVDVMGADDGAFRELAQAVEQFFHGDGGLSREFAPYTRTTAKRCFIHPQGEPWDVACFVAHGVIDAERHDLSGLLFARERGVGWHPVRIGGRKFDYEDLPVRSVPFAVRPQIPTDVLTGVELEIDGESRSELVCLFGCSAGWGRVLQADAPASLAETFLHIGSASVLAPMWDSHIEATREWALAFFKSWVSDGKPKALAARDATRELLPYNGLERIGALTLRGDWL